MIANQPYIAIKAGDSGYRVDGETHKILGHKIFVNDQSPHEGVYAEWIWDGSKLTVQNDQNGFQPLFYFLRRNEVAVSPSIEQLILLGAPLDLDYNALAVYMHMGHFIGEDTPFISIRALPPRADFYWCSESSEIKGGYTFPAAQNISRREAVGLYIERLRTAISRRPPYGKIAMPLSGGRDSRLLLLELARAGMHPDFCVTHDRKTDTDLSVAATLASRLDFSLISTVSKGNPSDDACQKLAVAGFCTMPGDIVWRIKDELIGSVGTVYHGIGGDTPTTTSSFQSERRLALFRSGDLDGLCTEFLGSEILGDKLLSNSGRRNLSFDVAATRLREELKKHQHTPNPIASFVFWNRTRRKLAQAHFSILAPIPKVYAPYLDRGILDLLFSIPAEGQMDFRFRDDVLQAYHPNFRDIPFSQEVSPSTEKCGQYQSKLGQSIARKILKSGMPSHLSSKLIWPRLLMLSAGLPMRNRRHWYMSHLIYGLCLNELIQRAKSGEGAHFFNNLSNSKLPGN